MSKFFTTVLIATAIGAPSPAIADEYTEFGDQSGHKKQTEFCIANPQSCGALPKGTSDPIGDNLGKLIVGGLLVYWLASNMPVEEAAPAPDFE